MLYKTTSAKTVIQRVLTRFRITDANIQVDAIEWIGSGIALIGMHVGYVNRIEQLEVDFHKIQIPDNFYQLNFIAYNGTKLKHGKKPNRGRQILTYGDDPSVSALVKSLAVKYDLLEAINDLDCCTGVIYEDLVNKENNLNREIGDLLTEANNSHYYNAEEWYTDGEGCYDTSIESGTVFLSYKAYPLDSEGYPLVVDEEKYLLALEWYILRSWMEGGNKHPTISYEQADLKTREALARATNEHLKNTYEQMDSFVSKWTNMTFRLREDNTNYYSN